MFYSWHDSLSGAWPWQDCHGKTAMAAHLVTENKNRLRPFLMALSTALTHAFSALVISISVHQLIHLLPGLNTHKVDVWVNVCSGTILVALAFYILIKNNRKTRKQEHCQCQQHQEKSSTHTQHWKSLLVGFAVGLVPCPSSLAALSTSLVSKDISGIIMIISMFSLGIFISLSLVGSLLTSISGKFKSMEKLRNTAWPSWIQSGVFALVGLWHISFLQKI